MTETSSGDPAGDGNSHGVADESSPRERPSSRLSHLRWGAAQLRARPELVVPFVVIGLAVTGAEAGVQITESEIGPVPKFAIWVWPVYLVAFLGEWVSLGAIFLAVEDIELETNRSNGEQVMDATSRLRDILGVIVIGIFPVVGGFFAFLIPGIYFSVKFSFALPACVIDDLGPVDALRRSFVTTSGHAITILSLLTTFLLLLLLSSVLITFVGGLFENRFIGPLLQNLFTAVLVPLFGLAFGRLYPISR